MVFLVADQGKERFVMAQLAVEMAGSTPIPIGFQERPVDPAAHRRTAQVIPLGEAAHGFKLDEEIAQRIPVAQTTGAVCIVLQKVEIALIQRGPGSQKASIRAEISGRATSAASAGDR